MVQKKPAGAVPGPAPKYWYDESRDQAFKLAGALELAAGRPFMDSNGYASFPFPDGDVWRSSIPAVGVVAETGHDPVNVKKRPAGSGQTAEQKLVFSRAYHKARQVYGKQCKDAGVPEDPERSKFLGRQAGKLALQDFQL